MKIEIANVTTPETTRNRLPIELYLPALDAFVCCVTQLWVWAAGRAVVGLDDRGDVVTVLDLDGDVRTVRAPLATALRAFGIEDFEIVEPHVVARVRGDDALVEEVGRIYASSGDERFAVLGDAILERDWNAVDYFERTYERAA